MFPFSSNRIMAAAHFPVMAPVQSPGLLPARARGLQAMLTARPAPRETLLLGLLLALLAALPAMLAHYPAMTDYAAHLARYHVMLDREQSPFLQSYYGFHWMWVGNLGADMLVIPLSCLFGIETAGRIIVILIPVLTGLGIVTVEWTLRRRVGLATMLAFVLIWSPSLLMGFLNFSLSLALALFAFALWVLLEGRRWRWAVFLPVGIIVFLCHVSGWGALGLIVFGYEWHRRKGLAAFIAPWPLTLPMVSLLLGGVSGAMTYGPNPLLYKRLMWQQALRGTWPVLDYVSLGLIAAVIIAALVCRRFDGRIGWGAVLVLLLALITPRHIFGGDYADYRLISTGLLLACLAFSWQAPRWLLYLAPVLFLVRLGIVTDYWVRDSQVTSEVLAGLDFVPPGARVASAVGVDLLQWRYNAQEHICGYAVLRRDALSNCNFALPGVHMLTMAKGYESFRDPSHRVKYYGSKKINLANFKPAEQADFLWFVGTRMPSQLPPGADVIYRSRHSVLARLAKPPGRS